MAVPSWSLGKVIFREKFFNVAYNGYILVLLLLRKHEQSATMICVRMPRFYFSAEISEILLKTFFTGYHQVNFIPIKVFRYEKKNLCVWYKEIAPCYVHVPVMLDALNKMLAILTFHGDYDMHDF
jgi:hypothetical protein